jgi:hypothetical protein
MAVTLASGKKAVNQSTATAVTRRAKYPKTMTKIVDVQPAWAEDAPPAARSRTTAAATGFAAEITISTLRASQLRSAAQSDSLGIMAKQVVEVRECDRCGKEPAHTWLITGPEGAVCEIDLCDRHGAPVANAYALGRSVPTRRAQRRRSTSPSVELPTSTDPMLPEPQWR